MHLLGVYVSDSRVSSISTNSMAFAINLSKNYDWSYDLGEASCYNLGKLGIYAHRTADKEPYVSKMKTPKGIREIDGAAQYQWQSENTPLLRWIRKTCLGYDSSPKTYQEVDAEWILQAPKNLRRVFLQGYSDGDGGVSIRGYYFAISTHSDHDFVQKLLGTFEVQTYRSKTYVRTSDFNAVIGTEKIPPFKYATERQKSLEKTVKMINSRRTSWKSNPPSADEVDFIRKLRKKGVSYGEIGEKFYDTYGYSLDARDVRQLFLGREKRKKEA